MISNKDQMLFKTEIRNTRKKSSWRMYWNCCANFRKIIFLSLVPSLPSILRSYMFLWALRHPANQVHQVELNLSTLNPPCIFILSTIWPKNNDKVYTTAPPHSSISMRLFITFIMQYILVLSLTNIGSSKIIIYVGVVCRLEII